MPARSHHNRSKRLARLRAMVTGENYQRALNAVRSDTIGAYVPLTTGVTAGTTRDDLVIRCPECRYPSMINAHHDSIPIRGWRLAPGDDWFCYHCGVIYHEDDVQFPDDEEETGHGMG